MSKQLSRDKREKVERSGRVSPGAAKYSPVFTQI